MPPGARPALGPWKRRPLTIPPNSLQAWIRLAAWEIWIGMLVCVILGFGISFILSSPDKIVTISDLSGCYRAPPIAMSCERIVYRGGMLNVAFMALCGFMLIGVAAWLLWELWNAVEPKPITDDFLKLLHDSFGRSWRNPFTWPWSRVVWAYGFTSIGIVLTVGVATLIWTLIVAPNARVPEPKVDTSQSFRTAP